MASAIIFKNSYIFLNNIGDVIAFGVAFRFGRRPSSQVLQSPLDLK